MHAMIKSIRSFFDLFFVFIDNGNRVCGGVRVCVGPWIYSNFQLVRGPQNCVLEHFQAEGVVYPKPLLKVV